MSTLQPQRLKHCAITSLLLIAAVAVVGSSAFAEFKVGLVLDRGGKDDKSFNASAYEGAIEAKKKLGITLKYVEASDDNAFEPLLRAFAQKDFDLIIGVGFAQKEAIGKIAAQFPKAHFAIVDAQVDVPNVRSLLFEEHEGAYIIGAIAAMTSKTGKVGFVGGMDVPLIRRFEMGYEAGAKKINPQTAVLANYVGVTSAAWNNPPKGKELAMAQYDGGVDVIFAAAGASGFGVFDAAEEKKKLAIGVDSNQDWTKPGFILTSMLKRVDLSVFSAIQDAPAGKFTGGVKRFGLADKGVDYSIDQYNEKLLPESIRQRADTLKAEIIAGKIVVPDYYKKQEAANSLGECPACRRLLTGIDSHGSNSDTAKTMAAEIPAVVELRGLTKHFGSVVANAGVNLRIEPGTIHGVIGENGAGKSTAMKVLFGIFPPDEGDILIDGTKRVWTSPADAIAAGIGMVHQHFMLAGPYTALDNILLGAEPVRCGVIERGKARARLEALARQYGLPVDRDVAIDELPVGVQQRIEILKLLYRDARILILDEPTAVLTPQEANELFRNLKKLREEGKTIILITHKLKEVMSFTDRITVFRAGKVTGEMRTAETNPQELANLMVGRKIVLNIEVPPARIRDDLAMEITGLGLAGTVAGGRHKLSDVSFSVRCGEIVGIAGVEGNGQSELLQAILHPRDPPCRTSGVVRFLGADVTTWEARRIRELGVAVIPEDRQHEGLLLERPVGENFLLGLQRSSAFSHAGFLNSKNLQAAAMQAVEEYDVRPRDLAIPAGNLSGGNQQKLIVAREFQRRPRVLIAAQPTRGVDVGAIEFIHNRIVRARDEGAGVLLVSFELDDILTLSDRILVMYEGRIVAEFERGVSERELGLKMAGS